jgi:putative glutamine amidotransferase
VLIGGADLDPRNDGFERHSSMRLLADRRERFDRHLIMGIASRHIPVLAIGAGMQLLNVMLGGTLYYHLPEDMPKALRHSDPTDPAHLHAITLLDESLLARVYTMPGRTTSRDFRTDPAVVSQHHMAIDDVAPGFTVTAKSADKVIEGIEWSHDDWLAVGVQFHPESPVATLMDFGVFEEWVALVKAPKLALAG